MSRIRGSDTQPELIVRRELWRRGLRYRIHAQTCGGRADIVIPGLRAAIFIDGCFWHGCPEHYVRPRSRNDFWDQKLRENVDRDRRQTLRLLDEGWRVLRFWEHNVREGPIRVAERIEGVLSTQRRQALPGWRVVRVEFLDEQSRVERRWLEDLLRPERVRVQERVRSTRKTGRVRSLRTLSLS